MNLLYQTVKTVSSWRKTPLSKDLSILKTKMARRSEKSLTLSSDLSITSGINVPITGSVLLLKTIFANQSAWFVRKTTDHCDATTWTWTELTDRLRMYPHTAMTSTMVVPAKQDVTPTPITRSPNKWRYHASQLRWRSSLIRLYMTILSSLMPVMTIQLFNIRSVSVKSAELWWRLKLRNKIQLGSCKETSVISTTLRFQDLKPVRILQNDGQSALNSITVIYSPSPSKKTEVLNS